jgi:UDP:flavonoid glycosyltransferase YjiC (YdhE family)
VGTDARRIVLSTWGSLGDLHPFLALAVVLARRGHRVSVATLPMWREHVERAGVGFHPLAPDIPEDEAAARKMVGRVLDAREGSKYLIHDLLGPSVRKSYDDLLAAVRADGGADLLVSHQLPMTGPIVAEVTGIKWVSIVLQPMPFFSAFDPPSVLPVPWMRHVTALHPSMAKAFNWLGRQATRSWIRPALALRSELGLPPGGNPLFEAQHSPALVLALFSPIFAPKQPDFPPQTLVTGFPFYDAAEQRAADPDLLRFLDDGDPPLLFTLGSSAVWIAGDFYSTSIDAARALGRRALLLAGEDTAALRARGLPAGIMAVDYAPHSIVMPRSLLSVHSGGIGTTAQALRAGRPMLVVPFAHDQPDNARRCVSLGVARSVSRRAYARARVVHELERLIADPSYAARAVEVGAAVAAEHGTATACDAIERVMAG